MPRGAGAAWSGDGRWLYYFTSTSPSQTSTCIEEIPVEGGPAVRVQCEAANMAVASNGSAIYYSPHVSTQGEIGRCTRKSVRPNCSPMSLSHVFRSSLRATCCPPMTGGSRCHSRTQGRPTFGLFPTDGGPARQLTDFGQRPILIARQVSWSPDGKFIYAAVVETDADIVLLDGMLQ